MGPIYNNFLFERGADRQLANIMGNLIVLNLEKEEAGKSSQWVEER